MCRNQINLIQNHTTFHPNSTKQKVIIVSNDIDILSTKSSIDILIKIMPNVMLIKKRQISNIRSIKCKDLNERHHRSKFSVILIFYQMLLFYVIIG